ncbi:hypothetical protein NX059_007962 [Plenodomus lindquistii]|nr:hypothetical protein NX059_007962 [Plenodomus lindquistii]
MVESTHETPTHPSQDVAYDYRIALDFGTKFTSIACSIRGGTPFTIQEFPKDPHPGRTNMQVPTEILYLSSQTAGVTSERTYTKRYGYEIQAFRSFPELAGHGVKEIGHITNPKLLLDSTPHLRSLQNRTKEDLKHLKSQKVISKKEEVIRDLLTCYLQHTKHVLRQYYGLEDTSTVEVTFCVPVCWDPSANAVMSACLQHALKDVGLGTSAETHYNLFMVNEAEAAATYTLTSSLSSYKSKEVFLLLDCGGGTTDVGVYEISLDRPFRLGRQINPTTGAVCGSGNLNQAFYEFAMTHLQHATLDGTSVEHIIETEIMPVFESTLKRSFSFKDKDQPGVCYPFRVRGLRKMEDNSRIKRDAFVLSFDDMKALFMPSLTTIADLMKRQIQRTLRSGIRLSKVVVAGGFGDSPALKEFLREALEDINKDYGTDTKLVTAPQNTGAAGVALGALLRATDKGHGPAKVPCQSIGIYHHVRNEPETYGAEVLDQHEDEWEYCPQDGFMYIKNTLHWIVKKGVGKPEAVHKYSWECLHIFSPANTTAWIAEHQLFASDSCTEDYYKRNHPKNYGKTHKIGKVVFDLMPIKPYLKLQTADDDGDGQDRYEPVVRIEMKIIDKYLDFTAYYPAEGVPKVSIRGVHEHINVISAFKPGTD